MTKTISNILWSVLILVLLLFSNLLIERSKIIAWIDYKLLLLIVIWIIACPLGSLLLSELYSYEKPDSLVSKLRDNWQPIDNGYAFPTLLNVPFYILIGMIISENIFESILETVGWEYKKILILPAVIIGLGMAWAWSALRGIAFYKEWSKLLSPETESEDHKSSRKRLLDIIILLCTFLYIFAFSHLIQSVKEEYLIFIIAIAIIFGEGLIHSVHYHFSLVLSLVETPKSPSPNMDSKEPQSSSPSIESKELESLHHTDSILRKKAKVQLQRIFKGLSQDQKKDNKLIEPIENAIEIKDEISCINCGYPQNDNTTELCSNCGLNIYVKVEYQTCTVCGSEYGSELNTCPVCGSS